MKTTVEIPDSLMRAIKMRAIQEGMKLKEIMPQLLENGLLAELKPKETLSTPRIGVDKDTGYPVILGGTRPKKSMTPQELSDILLAQEVEAYLRTS